jgi:hypothetical protein
MKSRLYLETTIPSYLTARPTRDLVMASHQQITREWWEKRRGNFDMFISEFVLTEARSGDPDAARRRLEILTALPLLEVDDTVFSLATEIVRAAAIPAKSAIDAAHIAVAAVNDVHFLLTWNCAHLANAEITPKVRFACEARGFSCPVICTPEELMGLKP